MDPETIGLHSLRHGGASDSGRAEVVDRLIQQQGRWKTQRMQVHYTSPGRCELAQVSRRIMEMQVQSMNFEQIEEIADRSAA